MNSESSSRAVLTRARDRLGAVPSSVASSSSCAQPPHSVVCLDVTSWAFAVSAVLDAIPPPEKSVADFWYFFPALSMLLFASMLTHHWCEGLGCPLSYSSPNAVPPPPPPYYFCFFEESEWWLKTAVQQIECRFLFCRGQFPMSGVNHSVR